MKLNYWITVYNCKVQSGFHTASAGAGAAVLSGVMCICFFTLGDIWVAYLICVINVWHMADRIYIKEVNKIHPVVAGKLNCSE
jgi:hypothetical protein